MTYEQNREANQTTLRNVFTSSKETYWFNLLNLAENFFKLLFGVIFINYFLQ